MVGPEWLDSFWCPFEANRGYLFTQNTHVLPLHSMTIVLASSKSYGCYLGGGVLISVCISFEGTFFLRGGFKGTSMKSNTHPF